MLLYLVLYELECFGAEVAEGKNSSEELTLIVLIKPTSLFNQVSNRTYGAL